MMEDVKNLLADRKEAVRGYIMFQKGAPGAVWEKSPSPIELTLNARTVRVGTFSGAPVEPILISNTGLNFFIEGATGTHTFHIYPQEIQQCLTRFESETNLIFFFTTQSCAVRTRKDLGMVVYPDPSKPPPEHYYDPLGTDSRHQMIIIVMDQLPVDFKKYMELFKSWGKQGDEAFLMELSKEEAEEIFRQSTIVHRVQQGVATSANVMDHGYSQAEEDRQSNRYTMWAQCIICQELLKNDDQVISAISCGHTFHNHCLNQWLENGRTCPSCRVQVDKKKIIERLYFDVPEDNDGVVDDGKLQNEIDRLKFEVRKREKEKNDIVKVKGKQDERIEELQNARDRMSKLLKEEQTKVSAHLKTLKYYESQQKAFDLERQEYRKIKQSLVTLSLQSLEVLLDGAESDADDIISSAGEGGSAVQHFPRKVTLMKSEYEKLKLEKHQMKELHEKIQQTNMLKNKKINDLTKQCAIFQEQLESMKMQTCCALKPNLEHPESSQNINLNLTPDLFKSPVKNTQSEHSEKPSTSFDTALSERSLGKSQKRSCDSEDTENQEQTKYLKITSEAEKNA